MASKRTKPKGRETLLRKASQPARQFPSQAVTESSKLPKGYAEFLENLKTRVRTAQIKAALSANRELIRLYWDIGRSIVERQRTEGWGRSVVGRLARDLQAEFPGILGFSPQNMWYMRAFYLAWTVEVASLQQPVGELDGENLLQAVGEIPWGHNLQLLSKVNDPISRLWYAQKTIEHGWSRAVLVHQVESGLHERQGKAVTNFDQALPPPQSDLARQALKDPYVFDFLRPRISQTVSAISHVEEARILGSQIATPRRFHRLILSCDGEVVEKWP